MDDLLARVQTYLDETGRAWEVDELPDPPTIPDRCEIHEPAAAWGSTGPVAGQWTSSFKAEDTWEQIFPDCGLDATGKIKTHPKPPQFVRLGEAERKKASTTVLTWMVAKDLNTTDTEAAVKAVKMIDLASKHEQRTLGTKLITDVHSFMKRYGRIILPGRAPPEIRVPMPAVVPVDHMLQADPMGGPPAGRQITNTEMTTINPNGGHAAGRRWKDYMRKYMQEDLIKCYMAHSFMVKQYNDWVTDESNIETWYKEANDTKKKEDDRTIDAVDLKPY